MPGGDFFGIALVVFLELNSVLTSLPVDSGMIALVAGKDFTVNQTITRGRP